MRGLSTPIFEHSIFDYLRFSTSFLLYFSSSLFFCVSSLFVVGLPQSGLIFAGAVDFPSLSDFLRFETALYGCHTILSIVVLGEVDVLDGSFSSSHGYHPMWILNAGYQ